MGHLGWGRFEETPLGLLRGTQGRPGCVRSLPCTKGSFPDANLPVPARGTREALCVGRSSMSWVQEDTTCILFPVLVLSYREGAALSPAHTWMLARLAVRVTLAGPFVRGDSAYHCLLGKAAPQAVPSPAHPRQLVAMDVHSKRGPRRGAVPFYQVAHLADTITHAAEPTDSQQDHGTSGAFQSSTVSC